MFKMIGLFLIVLFSGCSFVNTNNTVFLLIDSETKGSGTGFCVEEGLMLTNEHVCRSVKGIIVIEDSIAEIVFKDMTRDMCLLKTKKCTKFNSVTFSNRDGRQNEKAYVIGHPMGIDPQVKTEGYIAGKLDSPSIIVDIDPETCAINKGKSVSRMLTTPIFDEVTKTLIFKNEIQFGCVVIMKQQYSSIPIYPGSSGSPVFNSLGEVIGIVNKTIMNTVISMFLPNSSIQEFLKEYKLTTEK